MEQMRAAGGFRWHLNSSAWINTDIWFCFLRDLDGYLAARGERGILIYDGFSAHKMPDQPLSHLDMQLIPPNCTAHVQPMDAGIIASFKVHYKHLFLDHLLKMYCDTKECDIRRIRVVDAVRWVLTV